MPTQQSKELKEEELRREDESARRWARIPSFQRTTTTMDDPGAQEMSLAAMVEYMEQSQQHPHGDGHHQQHHVSGGGPVGGGGEPRE
jgi:hypothetical protein